MTASPQRLLLAALALLAWLALCAWVVRRERGRRRAADAAVTALAGATARSGAAPMLVAFASQTGMAEQLAWQAAQWLHAAGLPVRLAPLGQVDAGQLAGAGQALFLVSTYGEGDPPDNASRFARRVMDIDLRLPGLRYAVLALGDRSYANFCGFGRRLDDWLGRQGARPLFERIDVDRAGEPALAAWQEKLRTLAGVGGKPSTGETLAVLPAGFGAAAAAFAPWRIHVRLHLNPGSRGGPLYHLELRPADDSALPQWQAGDLVQLRVPTDPGRPRDYSIASQPSDGALHLLLREHRREDGTSGLASDLLLHTTAPVMLRLRPNPGFRLDGNDRRRLLLVGNGSGMAGLRALIKARAASADGGPVWLVFGEREAAHDMLYRDEISAWLAEGVLERVDRVFSRNAPAGEYVQHRLERCADRVRAWVEDGAAIYVCGSLRGMAGGVDAALARILGRDALDGLIDEGRYRRDVY